MALADIKLIKPYHLTLFKEQYDTGGEWDGETTTADEDITTIKAAFITDMHTAVDATSLSGGDKATLKTAIEAALNSNIPDTITATKDIKDVIVEMLDDFMGVVTGERSPNVCPECATTGLIPIYDTEGTDTGEQQESGLCDGFGYTETLKKRNPTGAGYIDA